MERRGFLGALFATVAGGFAWLIGGSPRRGDAAIQGYLDGDGMFAEDRIDQLRCVEACRIMREHGLHPFYYFPGDYWSVGNNSKQHFNDPVDALLASEPIHLAWKAEQENGNSDA